MRLTTTGGINLYKYIQELIDPTNKEREMTTMSKKEIQELIETACKERGYGTDDEEVIEMLRDAEDVHKEIIDTHRHWEDERHVVVIGGRLIGYVDAHATGNSADDLGFEFDPGTICEMKTREKIALAYGIAQESPIPLGRG